MLGFEELDVWQEGCKIAIEIYEITNKGEFAKDFGLRDQIRKCATSIPSNIAEGKERETVSELIRFLYIAKGSAGELKTQLFIACKIGYIDEQKYIYLTGKVLKVSGMLGNFIKKLKSEKGGKARKA
ncbi:MAG: four helix bundle protein [Nitrospirae bacterium]|nr:four helix bundle protein [Nitrospirota bacterium]